MEPSNTEILQGRKTFFITPDKTLIPPVFMEDYLRKAYECYIIDYDINIPIQQKIGAILSLFKDSIIFYNIDYKLDGITWPNLIKLVKNKYPDAITGVVCSKRNTPAEKKVLEEAFITRLEMNAGCIELDYQKNNNFPLIEKVLYENHASGRRKSVRAMCQRNGLFNFENQKGQKITYWLNDISLSHFSFTVQEGDTQFNVKDYEKVNNLSFVVKGIRFKSDAVLFLKRETPTGMLYVFAFVAPNGQIGLDPIIRDRIVPKIYELLQDSCFNLIKKTYDSIVIDPNTSEFL